MGLFEKHPLAKLFEDPDDPEVLPISTKTPEQEALLRRFIESSEARLTGQPQFGQLPPGPTNIQALSLEALEELSRQAISGGGPFAGAEQAQETFQGLLSDTFDPEQFEEFFRGAIEEPALRAFQERVLPGISRRSAGSFFGSERRETDIRAREDLIQALTQSRAGLAFDEEQARLDRTVRTLGLAPSVLGQRQSMLDQLFAAGERERRFGVEEFTARRDEFRRQLDEDFRRRNQILAILGLEPVENVVIPGEFSFLQQFLLGAAGGVGAGAAAGAAGGGGG